jgi:hypothetical protein
MAVSDGRTASRSSHVSDPALTPFLASQFDPAEYLNAALPSLSLSSASSRPPKSGNASLADLSSQTQDLLSQLNAHTTRLSAILTQLTDDILRSGARLAYEVEVLRGETIGLNDTLTDGLKPDITKFVPGGIKIEAEQLDTNLESPTLLAHASEETDAANPPQAEPEDTTPEYLSDLRTLTTVRTRLDTVIKVFGEAMHWTLPPSETSLTSSLISVSAPDPSTDAESKGTAFAASLRSEIADLVTGDLDGGAEKAEARIQALRELAKVWKGTAEEKARAKFVDGLVRLAEERQREVEKERERNRERGVQRPAGSGSVQRAQQPAVQQQRSGGFLENLQRRFVE